MIEESEKKLLNWLKGIKFDEYFSLFQNAAYDLQTISRMTPEVSALLFLFLFSDIVCITNFVCLSHLHYQLFDSQFCNFTKILGNSIRLPTGWLVLTV